MFGLIQTVLEEFISEHFGEAKWLEVLCAAGLASPRAIASKVAGSIPPDVFDRLA